MNSSVGMMTFPIWWEKYFTCSKPPTRKGSFSSSKPLQFYNNLFIPRVLELARVPTCPFKTTRWCLPSCKLVISPWKLVRYITNKNQFVKIWSYVVESQVQKNCHRHAISTSIKWLLMESNTKEIPLKPPIFVSWWCYFYGDFPWLLMDTVVIVEHCLLGSMGWWSIIVHLPLAFNNKVLPPSYKVVYKPC